MVNRAARRAAGQRGTQKPQQESPGTYWNGEPTPARRVRVVVGAPPEDMPHHWLHGSGLVGETVDAVEVTYPAWDGPMYLYDGDGLGWRKVTVGHGSPAYGHKNIPVERIVGTAPNAESAALAHVGRSRMTTDSDELRQQHNKMLTMLADLARRNGGTLTFDFDRLAEPPAMPFEFFVDDDARTVTFSVYEVGS